MESPYGRRLVLDTLSSPTMIASKKEKRLILMDVKKYDSVEV